MASSIGDETPKSPGSDSERSPPTSNGHHEHSESQTPSSKDEALKHTFSIGATVAGPEESYPTSPAGKIKMTALLNPMRLCCCITASCPPEGHLVLNPHLSVQARLFQPAPSHRQGQGSTGQCLQLRRGGGGEARAVGSPARGARIPALCGRHRDQLAWLHRVLRLPLLLRVLPVDPYRKDAGPGALCGLRLVRADRGDDGRDHSHPVRRQPALEPGADAVHGGPRQPGAHAGQEPLPRARAGALLQ